MPRKVVWTEAQDTQIRRFSGTNYASLRYLPLRPWAPNSPFDCCYLSHRNLPQLIACLRTLCPVNVLFELN